MSMLKEFKEFALRGNVVDMAVGIIIGAAFGKITSSLVKDIIMPPIGKLVGNADFTELYFNLGSEIYASLADAQAAGAATINYGVFLATILDFVIIAFAIFMLIKGMNRMKRKEAAAPAPAPTTKECPYCLTSIPLAATRCSACTSELSK